MNNIFNTNKIYKTSHQNEFYYSLVVLINFLLILLPDLNSYITLLNSILFVKIYLSGKNVEYQVGLTIYLLFIFYTSSLFSFNSGIIYGASDELTTYLNHRMSNKIESTFFNFGSVFNIESYLYKSLLVLNNNTKVTSALDLSFELKKLSSLFGILTYIEIDNNIKLCNFKKLKNIKKWLIILFPFVIYYSIIGVRDIILAYLILAAYNNLIKFLQIKKIIYILKLLLLLTLSYLVRPEHAVLFALLFSFLIFNNKYKRCSILLLVLAISVFFIYILPKVTYILRIYSSYNDRMLSSTNSLANKLRLLPFPINIIVTFLYSLLCIFPASYALKSKFLVEGNVDGIIQVSSVFDFSIAKILKFLGFVFYHIYIINYSLSVFKYRDLDSYEKKSLFLFVSLVFSLSFFGVDSGHFLIGIPIILPHLVKRLKANYILAISLFIYFLLNFIYILIKY
jgi:hypothetical protein